MPIPAKAPGQELGELEQFWSRSPHLSDRQVQSRMGPRRGRATQNDAKRLPAGSFDRAQSSTSQVRKCGGTKLKGVTGRQPIHIIAQHQRFHFPWTFTFTNDRLLRVALITPRPRPRERNRGRSDHNHARQHHRLHRLGWRRRLENDQLLHGQLRLGHCTTDDPLIIRRRSTQSQLIPAITTPIYAGTGDLNYGSFSMGSQGIFKSTDGARPGQFGRECFRSGLHGTDRSITRNTVRWQSSSRS